jgi:hypothetical protein
VAYKAFFYLLSSYLALLVEVRAAPNTRQPVLPGRRRREGLDDSKWRRRSSSLQKQVICFICRVGQNQIWCIYGIFGRKITKYMVYI